MTDRTPRSGYTDTRWYRRKPVTTGSVIAAYGVALLIPVALWAISEPLLAAGLAALVGGAYAVGRIGLRLLRRRRRAQAVASARTDSAHTRSAEPES